MSKQISAIENDVQDRKSVAWKKLCLYIDELAKSESDEFTPIEYLGEELFSGIYTLPETISKLKKVRKISLYGSKLKRIPPEIGEMKSLEYFDPYTSYSLHWFPYELTHCKFLKDSRISTRVLYGNYKNRMQFPNLKKNPVRYFQEFVKCSICRRELSYEQISQFWISLRIGTDVVPLLVNSCSELCTKSLPVPPKNYVQHPHKGGNGLKQPLTEGKLWKQKRKQKNLELERKSIDTDKKPKKLFRVIKKIWEEY